jgi:hypothetical protein
VSQYLCLGGDEDNDEDKEESDRIMMDYEDTDCAVCPMSRD